MDTLQNVKDKITQDFKEKSCVYVLLNEVLEHLRNSPRKRLSFKFLFDLVAESYSIEDFKEAVKYLTGERVRILKTSLELIDDNDDSYPITKEEYDEADKTGELIHPQYGRPVKDFDDKICFYFEKTPLLDELLECYESTRNK